MHVAGISPCELTKDVVQCYYNMLILLPPEQYTKVVLLPSVPIVHISQNSG